MTDGNGERVEPKGIAFDVDGVIADTMRLFLDIARDEFDVTHIRYEDITRYNLEECIDLPPGVIDGVIVRLLEGGYRSALNPIPGAPAVLNRLAGSCGSVLLVTARPAVGPIAEFIRGILPCAAECADIVATGSYDAKAEVLLARGVTHFVEDRLETCFALEAAGIAPILFVQPWNREPHPFIEVSSWDQIEGLIRWG
ncbi:MAG: haloacid dehalogenase [Desulfobacterales bacterium]|nr:haloacid dehalogenase [Desulfobacterales bacterium]